MLKYEWRPGITVGDDDAVIDIYNDERDDNIILEPIRQDMPAVGPNPFAINPNNIADGLAPQGAENNNGVEIEERQQPQREQATVENQGAPVQNENQGAPVPNQDTHQGAQHDTEMSDSDDEDTDTDSDSSDDEEPASRSEERNRRSSYFDDTNHEDYGRGKRERKTTSYSFLQTKFQDLKDTERQEFFHAGWKEYQLLGSTNLLKQYTTGFMFTQMSAKKGIQKYGREAELKLLGEFKQLMEYKTFHGRKAHELSYDQKKKAANMISLIEEKIN